MVMVTDGHAQNMVAQQRPVTTSASAEAAVSLETLSVTGQSSHDDPRGPIDGYVARRAATATKTNTPLNETPQSITVIGRKQLDDLRPHTVSDAIAYTAGVYSTHGPATVGDFFSIRGFDATGTGVYKDGLQLLGYSFSGFQGENFGLERIDVLRGPAAVLFGQGGPGGIINLITKRPTEVPFGHVEAGGGSFGQKYLAFDLGGPSSTDPHWFYRVTGLGRQGGTQVDGVDDNRGYIAPAITYKPDGATSFTLLAGFQYDDTGRLSPFLPYYGTVRPQALGLRIPRSYNIADPKLDTFRRTQFHVGYEFEHAFNDTFTFRQNLRYSQVESLDTLLFSGQGYSDARQTIIPRARYRLTSQARLFNVDNQLVARFNDGFFAHTFLVGLDYKQYQLHDTQAGSGPATSFDILAPRYGVPAPPVFPYLVNRDAFQQIGLYAQDQIDLTDRLKLVVGGRGDFTTNDVDDKLRATRTRQEANVATQRYALIYNFDHGLAPYLSYSTFFNPQVGTNFGGTPFKPVTGDQYEAGLKYQPPDNRFSATFALFDLTQSNTLTADPTNPFNQLQIGETRSKGFETQIVANINRELSLVGSFTAFDIAITRGLDSQIGKIPVATPSTLTSVFADYTIATGSFAGFGVGAGLRYVGNSYADAFNTLKVPEYVLFDSAIHYARDGWRFALNVSNMADRRYVGSCSSISSCNYGEERRFTASVGYRW
ncbi:TonB-dependent siderophore receptor [Methylobacterium sp. E-045]|uniref:TonB-dependent siderophore receptor n=1 Tax=Methylobacterium sp. E-045 TaxID=2836575 RepID=UPI001FB9C9A2|nr:TonB-dependent siderophore receptor [Methylobacterium sp. E-045]MCJ2128250.1 TonB-dependent siderophore receptor [Methylobacterium sp. E-045]